MSNRFYVNSPLAPGIAKIDGAEARHMAAVCRLRPGDPVCLFNGDGAEYPGRIESVAKSLVTVDVAERRDINRELPFQLIVASAVPKVGRAEFLVEKLTELGVARFVPLRTARSVVHPAEGKLDKLRRTVIEASKQCGRNRLMGIDPLTDWAELVRRDDLPATLWIAAMSGESGSSPAGDRIVAIGPEGGWTPEELAAASAAGWTSMSLGSRVLRVETAAIAAAVRWGS